MVTIEQIQDDVNIARLYYIQQLSIAGDKLVTGIDTVKKLYPLKRLIKALTFEINANVIDDGTLLLYRCLLEITSYFVGNYVPDPDVKTPTQVIVVTNQPDTIVKDENNLIFDTDSGGWYLPFEDENDVPYGETVIPVLVSTNGVSFSFGFDKTFYPKRIYGFTGNQPQVIELSTI